MDTYSAVWSPAGTHLAYAMHGPNTCDNGLWVFELATGETQLLRIATDGSLVDEIGLPGEIVMSVGWSLTRPEAVKARRAPELWRCPARDRA